MSPPQVTTAAGTHYEICDSLQILIEEHALCGKCLDVQFASAAGEDADGTFFDAGPSANEHGERGSLRAVGIPFQFVVVRPDGNIEGLVLDYRPPEFGAGAVFVVVAEDGYVTYKHAVGGFAEVFAFQFGPEEVGLVLAQLGEVVESCIDGGGVGFVFTCVENHKSGAAPCEGSVGLVVAVAYEVVHAGRVEIANLVVAANEDDRLLCPVDRVGAVVYHLDGIAIVGGLGQAVAVEYNEIIIHVFDERPESVIDGLDLMQVVEDKGSEVGRIEKLKS